MVTLNHFSVPGWFARDGAWNNPQAPERFARYCAAAAAHFSDAVTWYCTLNEPNLGALMTLGGTVPMAAFEDVGAVPRTDPQGRRASAEQLGGDETVTETGSPIKINTVEATENVMEAHRQTRAATKRVRPEAMVGWTLARTTFRRTPKPEPRLAR